MSPAIFYIPNNKHPAEANMTKRNLLLAEMIVNEGLGKVAAGRAASDEEVLLFHTPEYVEAVKTGYPDTLASSGQHWYETIYDDMKNITGSMLDAIDEALMNMVSGSLAGGGHHATPDSGGALSVLNHAAIGVMYAKRKVGRVFMLDLDLHFSNGTTIGLADVQDVFLFDYHGQAYNFSRPNIPHLFRKLSGSPSGMFYLKMLKSELPRAIDQFRPDLCIYLSGMDVYKGSHNARLFLSEKDIESREEFVFNQFAERKIPVAYTHGGGYFSEETAARLYRHTAKAAANARIKGTLLRGAKGRC